MKLVRIAALAGLALALAALAGVARPDPAAAEEAPTAAGESARSITVSGMGIVSAVPDRAAFTFGVESEGRTASQALAANSTAMARVVAALRGAGVAAADLQTQQVFVSPRYTDDGRAIVGYVATNSVLATIRQLSRAGAVIDAAVQAGANQVSGPSLSSGDRTDRYARALRAAVDDARGKARAIADAAGATVGRVLAVQEAGATPPPVPVAEAGATRASDVPIEPGVERIEAHVTVVFALA